MPTGSRLEKVHWNCHGHCNLSCRFCYGMFTGHEALDTKRSLQLIDKVADAGIPHIVFTGGDPLQRTDLTQLIDHANVRGLRVEVQTNAQHPRTIALIEALRDVVSLWGLSIDSAESRIHDSVRGRPGNHLRCIQAGARLTELGLPWLLRTLISRPTVASFLGIGDWLGALGFEGVWYLLQYLPIGDESANSDEFLLTDQEFNTAAQAAINRYKEQSFKTVSVGEPVRRGIYFLMAPDGAVYNQPPPGEQYSIVGNIMCDDFESLERRLMIDYTRHAQRFGVIVPRAYSVEMV